MLLRAITVVGILSVLGSSPVSGQWIVERETDSMTDEVSLKAVTRNADGFELSVSRLQGAQRVYGTFRLPRQNTEVLEAEQPAMYRVDKTDAVTLKVDDTFDELVGRKSVITEPKWVHFILWHGEDETVQAGGSLGQFMAGESVVFRYFLFTGGFKETTFSLDGAGDAIAEAIGAELSTPGSTRIEVTATRNQVISAFEVAGLSIGESSAELIVSNSLQLTPNAPNIFVRYRASMTGNRAVLSVVRRVEVESIGLVGDDMPLDSGMTDDGVKAAWQRLERIAETLRGE